MTSPRPPALALAVAALTVAIGAVFVLAEFGLIATGRPDPTIPIAQQHALTIGMGVVFASGGGSVLLNAVPGLGVGIANRLLGLMVSLGLAFLLGWVAIGPGARDFSSPLAILGPRVNEAVGRVMFGLGALLGLLMAVLIVLGVARPPRSPSD